MCYAMGKTDYYTGSKEERELITLRNAGPKIRTNQVAFIDLAKKIADQRLMGSLSRGF
jgi:hypothetical protein